jgi:hypothetical protein
MRALEPLYCAPLIPRTQRLRRAPWQTRDERRRKQQWVVYVWPRIDTVPNDQACRSGCLRFSRETKNKSPERVAISFDNNQGKTTKTTSREQHSLLGSIDVGWISKCIYIINMPCFSYDNRMYHLHEPCSFLSLSFHWKPWFLSSARTMVCTMECIRTTQVWISQKGTSDRNSRSSSFLFLSQHPPTHTLKIYIL